MTIPLPDIHEHRVFALFSFRISFEREMNARLAELIDAPESEAAEDAAVMVNDPSLQGRRAQTPLALPCLVAVAGRTYATSHVNG